MFFAKTNLPSSESENSCRWPGLDIHYLIYEADDFIVFLDRELDIDWQTTASYDQKGPRNETKHNEMLNHAATLECIPNHHHTREIRLNFKRMVGEGVVRSLMGDYDNADKILRDAEAYIIERNIEVARFWQMSTAIVLAIVFGILGLAFWAFRMYLILQWGEGVFFLIQAASIGGTLGAVLSMAFRMGRCFPRSEAPRRLHILEAVSRVLAGGLSGLVIAASVKIGLILPIFKDSGNIHLAMFVTAFAAGASERLAPSLIAHIEGSSDIIHKKKGEPQ